MNSTSTFFFTADEHYGHANIIKYCNRPFASVAEMDAEIIQRHNEMIGPKDVVIHAGDFTLSKKPFAENYIRQLNGTHIFLKGSHDYWLKKSATVIWEKEIEGFYVVACHFAMRVWPRSHYNSWQLYGHSHGNLPPIGKQWDIGVDNNDFYPVSFNKVREIMQDRPDNPNFVGNKDV
jgi:calcineurin-like phosphoesterase family protein